MRTGLLGLFARLGPPGEGDLGDDQLLAAFVASRDEAAFQQIVRRHGPMVHGVCRRVLRNEPDADDAFQAVFVVLVRKAASVRPGNLLGNWLYGVAVNVARKGREVLARRRTQELVGDLASPGRESGGEANGELREVIDQELMSLPADYRAAVVACDLEGWTRKEAAGRLGWSEGTVASRLARARAILADRLTRRGVGIPTIGLGAALGAGSPALAALPRVVLAGHSEIVSELAGEAMRAMSVNKLKTAATVLLAAIGVASVGTGVVLACGGYGPYQLVTPVSPAKPFPLQSIATSSEGGEHAAAAKPMAGTDDSTDRQSGGNGGTAKGALFVLRNPERDITILSDRDETFVEFFRRQRVMIAKVDMEIVRAALLTQKISDRVFVSNASYNENGVLSAVYGSNVRIAPIDLEQAQLSGTVYQTNGVILVADPVVEDLWHMVGSTTHSSTGFFTAKDKKGRDDFAPADLVHTPKK